MWPPCPEGTSSQGGHIGPPLQDGSPADFDESLRPRGRLPKTMLTDSFIARWSASGDAERANKDSFLNELCDVLGIERPHPKTGDPARDLYVFEKDVMRTKAGGTSIGRVDLFKHDSFLLEAKQGAATGSRRRDSPAWNQMMSDAHGQGLGYSALLDAPPPFLLVCDIGYCFDVYASFDGTGVYRAFPDGHRKRLFLRNLTEHADLLRAIWTDPHSLDPSKRAAAVTRDIAVHMAGLDIFILLPGPHGHPLTHISALGSRRRRSWRTVATSPLRRRPAVPVACGGYRRASGSSLRHGVAMAKDGDCGGHRETKSPTSP
jgi:restriction-modification enzyme MmeI-like protein